MSVAEQEEPDQQPGAEQDPLAPARRQRVYQLIEGRRLTPTQRRIASCLIANSHQAPFLTSNDLAELAHVSQASVTRFANALGFEGYPQLRRALRTVVAPLDLDSSPLARMNDWQRSLTFEIGSLEELRRQLGSPEPVRRAAEILARSRPLSVLGLRSAAPLAQYFAYFASKVLPDVRALAPVGTVAMADALEQARSAGAESLLAFLLPRYPRESVRLLEIARELGFRIVCITDGAGSPAGELAELVLYAPVESTLVFDSHAAPMTLSLVLLDAICTVDPGSAQERLDRFDAFAAANELFV